jgi:HAD superfamily hydrolase (TIGR01450 family)
MEINTADPRTSAGAAGNARGSAQLQERLAGVRGLVLDLDGVLTVRGVLLPGADEALGALDARGLPYLVGTNVSLASRATLARELTEAGLPISAERIVSAVSTAGALARRRYGSRPLYVMASQDALTEFAGLQLLSHDEAAEPEARVAAVIVGDAADEFTSRNMQSAFRLVRNGARLVAMHKNRWWLTPDGATLDAGAYVAGLEFATERRAFVTGKPSPTFFREAVRLLAQKTATGRRTASRFGTWQWSATTCGTTSEARRRPAYVAFSFGRASTATRSWRAPPSEAAGHRMPLRLRS